jgi:hypothetical protein
MLIAELGRLNPAATRQTFSSLQQWAYRFLARRGLSIRRFTRNVTISDVELNARKLELLEQMAAAQMSDDGLVFINMDETAIQYEMTPRSTIEFVGPDAVPLLSGNKTARVTAALTVCSDGARLPSFVIFKGSPSGRVRRECTAYSRRVDNEVVFSVQENAWMDTPSMLEWIDK